LVLERYPLDPEALTSAIRLVESLGRGNRPHQARAARLAHAPRFVPTGEWFAANPSDSLRDRAEEFAQTSFKQTALDHHHRAREGETASWDDALRLYEVFLEHWPFHDEAPTLHTYAGEAAAELGRYGQALAHYEAGAFKYYEKYHPKPLEHELVRHLDWRAIPDTSRFLTQVDWQRLTLSDAWYRSTIQGSPGRGRDSLAVILRHIAQGFADRHPSDPRSPDALWRKANLTLAHRWFPEAAEDFGQLVARFPEDDRTPLASALRGDALYRTGIYDGAGAAYETALAHAERARMDSLITALEPLLPHCAFRHAEQADSLGSSEAPPLFEQVAARWTDYEHAGLALYRAGLGYARTGETESAVAAWTRLIEDHPRHEYARDAHLQIAATWKAEGRFDLAAHALEKMSIVYPEDAEAPEALLEAADLLEKSGDADGAGALRLSYVDRFPEDVETGMAILAEFARHELEKMDEDATLSSVLNPSSPGASPDPLARYLDLADRHPELASGPLLARTQFLRGEEMWPAYRRATLGHPLEKSITVKRNRLQKLIETYGRCAEWGVAEWTRASSYRIGEALVEFGQALEQSPRPPGLAGDDLAAYEEVLLDEAWAFYDRGEEAWAQILRETRGQAEDPGAWIARTQETLWPRLAQRFLFRPEVEFPLVAAEPPGPKEPAEETLTGAPERMTPAGAAIPAQE
jgi:tetratricopeptide (TPR) repeat protein